MMAKQLAEAGMLLGVGMAVVFAFLTLLIGAIQLIAWFCKRFPENEIETNKYTKPKYSQNRQAAPSSDLLSPNIVAAISAAVHTHRRAKAKTYIE